MAGGIPCSATRARPTVPSAARAEERRDPVFAVRVDPSRPGGSEDGGARPHVKAASCGPAASVSSRRGAQGHVVPAAPGGEEACASHAPSLHPLLHCRPSTDVGCGDDQWDRTTWDPTVGELSGRVLCRDVWVNWTARCHGPCFSSLGVCKARLLSFRDVYVGLITENYTLGNRLPYTRVHLHSREFIYF
jgi:hypothetical protein